MEGKITLEELLAQPDEEEENQYISKHVPKHVFESEDDRKARYRNYYRRYRERLKRQNPEKLRAMWRESRRNYIRKKQEKEEAKYGVPEKHPVLFKHGEGA